jgi:hypothetical protein
LRAVAEGHHGRIEQPSALTIEADVAPLPADWCDVLTVKKSLEQREVRRLDDRERLVVALEKLPAYRERR